MAKAKKAKVVHPEAKGLLVLGAFTLLLISLLTFHDALPEANWLGTIGYYTALGCYSLIGLGSFFMTACGFWYGWHLLTKKSVDTLKLKTLYFIIFIISTGFIFNALSEMHLLTHSWLQTHSVSESTTVNAAFNHRTVRYNLGGIPLYYLYRDLPVLNLQTLLSDLGVLCTFGIVSIVSGVLFLEMSVMRGLKIAKQGAIASGKAMKKVFEKLKKMELKETLFDQSEEKALVPVTPKKAERKKITTPELKVKANANAMPSKIDRSQIVDVENVKIHRDTSPKLNLEENFKAARAKTQYKRAYDLPPLSLLTNAKKIDHPSLEKELKSQATILEETLLSFGIEAKVGEINCGPTITSFEVHPAVGVKVQKIKAVEDDIALNMQARSIRIIAPIPGKAVVGVEVPSLYPQEVGFKEMLYHYSSSKGVKHNLPIVLGKTVSGDDVMCDLTKMPHCIIAGATGSGKSVCVNTIIMSMLMTMSPDDVKLILIDPKKVELTPFSDLPHLIAPVITEPQGAHAALNWVVREMQTRYDILKQLSLRNITAFNQRTINAEKEAELDIDIPEKMHWIVMIIDEFADLMMTSDQDLETPIARIAQMARAVGIHMILATQRPSREVITGLIKANFPSRISFKVASRVNSQIIIDESGAEMLLGNGDMLFVPPTASQPIRAQGAFIRDEDINRVIRFIKDQRQAEYMVESFDTFSGATMMGDDDDDSYKDTLFPKAVEIVMSTKTASTTFLQRKLKVGYARAASLMDELEDRGIIGPQEGSKPRKILAHADLFEGDGE